MSDPNNKKQEETYEEWEARLKQADWEARLKQAEWEEFVERQRQDSLKGARGSGGLVSEEEVNNDYDWILNNESPETYN